MIAFVWGAAASDGVDEAEAEKAVTYLSQMGWVRRYVAGSGAEDESVRPLKLVDWLRQRGFEVSTVGGPPPAEIDYRRLVNVMFVELARQAANLLATAPDHVIAYAGATASHALAWSCVQLMATGSRAGMAGRIA